MALMTEREYRALPIDSYSSFKVFADDRRKYYRKFVLRESVVEEQSDEIIFGLLVDTLRLEPEEYDNRFALSISQIPTAQYGKLVAEMLKIAFGHKNDQGEVSMDIEDIIETAYNRVKFDRDGTIVAFKRDGIERVKEKYYGSDLEVYYRQRLEAEGKIIIELSTKEKALELVREMNTNFVTKDIMNLESDEFNTIYNQLPIIGEISSELTDSIPYPAKCLPDKLVIDHRKKEVTIYDLKTTWDNELNFTTNYLKYRYYLQAALYFYLVVEWVKKIKSLEGYRVNYPKFIVLESNNYKNPLIYTTDHNIIMQGMKGFIHNGKIYRGLIPLVKDIMWHKEMGIWNISKENYINNGIVPIKPIEM